MRMLGRVYASFCPVCRGASGWDCPDKGKGTRAAKRIEQRGFEAEFARWSDWYDTDEGRVWLNGPLLDVSDCQHGCNGDCGVSGSLRCDFTCHEYRCENCADPATMWLDTGWFCSYECDAEYSQAMLRGLR